MGGYAIADSADSVFPGVSLNGPEKQFCGIALQ